MESIKLSSNFSQKIKLQTEEIPNFEKGITKGLLEKYKPKILYNIETLNGKKVQRRVAKDYE